MGLRSVSLENIKQTRLQKISPYFMMGELSKYAILGGGSLRTIFDKNDKLVDFDLFFRQSTDLEAARRILERYGCKLVFACPKGELFTYKSKDGLKFQCIFKKAFENVGSLIESFDFTVCQFAISNGILWFTDEALLSLKRKELHLNKLTYPVASIFRAYKYRDKGFNIFPAVKEIVAATEGNVYTDEELELYTID